MTSEIGRITYLTWYYTCTELLVSSHVCNIDDLNLAGCISVYWFWIRRRNWRGFEKPYSLGQDRLQGKRTIFIFWWWSLFSVSCFLVLGIIFYSTWMCISQRGVVHWFGSGLQTLARVQRNGNPESSRPSQRPRPGATFDEPNVKAHAVAAL